MENNISNLNNSLLPALLSQYQNAIQPGQSPASAASAKTALQNFSTLLQISMENQLTSMISSFNSIDSGDSSNGSSSDNSNPLSGLLGGSQTGSTNSLASLLGNLGSGDGSSSSSDLLSSLLGTGAAGSSSNASLLSSLLGSSGDSSSLLSALTGSQDSSSLTGSLLGTNSNAYQQLLASQMLQNYQNNGSTYSSLPLSAQAAHINQFQADLLNGGDGISADCGPASLVMALHELGLHLPNETTSTNAGQAIDLARLSMVGTSSTVDQGSFTSLANIQHGAAAAGAKTATVNPTSADIMHYLQEGGRVVVSGTFTGKSPLPWTGDSGYDSTTAPGGAANHVVEVSSYDPFSKLFTINDPARSAPHQVTAATLDYFISGNSGAVGIRL